MEAGTVVQGIGILVNGLALVVALVAVFIQRADLQVTKREMKKQADAQTSSVVVAQLQLLAATQALEFQSQELDSASSPAGFSPSGPVSPAARNRIKLLLSRADELLTKDDSSA